MGRQRRKRPADTGAPQAARGIIQARVSCKAAATVAATAAAATAATAAAATAAAAAASKTGNCDAGSSHAPVGRCSARRSLRDRTTATFDGQPPCAPRPVRQYLWSKRLLRTGGRASRCRATSIKRCGACTTSGRRVSPPTAPGRAFATAAAFYSGDEAQRRGRRAR